ncbi:alanine racemase [Bartonella tamiae]|uniref:Alanine racemase n=1 Tax=Bartonella tamiae Th239 TaxID=1094558 RepID=J1JWF4_9HYPH|nr:alanine racemase [Bartonella tamiae]EJF89347.1 alanine racemase [Bartonella tamiae Th239]EJF92788.1 alanine racemase [Bartonella tamiae Th307]
MPNTENEDHLPIETYGAIATIDLDAIAHNYQLLCKKIAPAQCSAVVKADAYGLGAANVAHILYKAGCRIFFVAQLNEGRDLKKVLPQDAIIAILNGLQPGSESIAAQNHLVPVLNSWDAILRWQNLCIKRRKNFAAIIQVDTGMARLGLDAQECKFLSANTSIFNDANILFLMSHLASGDEKENPSNARQLQCLKDIKSTFPNCPIALSNSGGIFLEKSYYFDLVRAGIALYGVAPNHKEKHIKPVLKLDARVIQSRHVEKGQAIGYGGDFITKHPSTITTIAMGYADGWHRSLGNKGSAFYAGQRLPILGRISMDSITLDTSDLPILLKAGDLVELIGEHQSLEEVAKDAGTISYEILTSLSRRCARVYLQNGKTTRL